MKEMDERKRWLAAALLALTVSPAQGQGDEHTHHVPPAAAPAPTEPLTEDAKPGSSDDAMPGMDHSTMPGMDHGATSAPPKESSAMPGMKEDSMPGMDHSTMPGMDHGGHAGMQHDAAPSELRDPHAYSGGYDFSQFPMRHEGGDVKYGMLRVDRLEAARSGGDTFTTWDLQVSYGGDFDRALFKTEGDARGGDLDEVSHELLWSHATSAFWNAQLGVRHDGGAGPGRGWLAFGLQGLAPYWFEIDATAYLGDAGRTALDIEADYELLLTQKLILQPRLAATAYRKDDAARGIGAGLAEVTAGVRLRYEIRREFAPYIGVEWSGAFGATADRARAAGEDAKQTRAVAGVRFWF